VQQREDGGRGNDHDDEPRDHQAAPARERGDRRDRRDRADVGRTREREHERDRHEPGQAEIDRPGLETRRLERDAAGHRDEQQQIAAERIGLALLALERRRHALSARDLREPDQADDHRGEKRRGDEAPRLASVDEVVDDHVINDEVLDVLEDVERAAEAGDRSGHVADQGRDAGRGHVREDRPVERGLQGETELLVDGGLGEPAERDDQQQDVFAPDHDAAPLGNHPAAAELWREQHREDHEVEAELDPDEDDEEDGQRGGQDKG